MGKSRGYPAPWIPGAVRFRTCSQERKGKDARRSKMHCSNCGAELAEGATFCAKCGTAAGKLRAAETLPSPGGGLRSNVAALLCYLIGFITGIFFLVVDPYKRDRFVRFHAFQAIFLSAAWFALYFVFAIFSAILPFMLWRVMWMLDSLLGFTFFLLWVFLMYKAYNNEEFKLPVIGDLAAKQA
jgi:uncharacterized membrane protein/ribosomal protein L40E